jgi:hypothetical protein
MLVGALTIALIAASLPGWGGLCRPKASVPVNVERLPAMCDVFGS